jgi:hypothetical protein
MRLSLPDQFAANKTGSRTSAQVETSKRIKLLDGLNVQLARTHITLDQEISFSMSDSDKRYSSHRIGLGIMGTLTDLVLLSVRP